MIYYYESTRELDSWIGTRTHTHMVIGYICSPNNSMKTCRPASVLLLIYVHMSVLAHIFLIKVYECVLLLQLDSYLFQKNRLKLQKVNVLNTIPYFMSICQNIEVQSPIILLITLSCVCIFVKKNKDLRKTWSQRKQCLQQYRLGRQFGGGFVAKSQ